MSRMWVFTVVAADGIDRSGPHAFGRPSAMKSILSSDKRKAWFLGMVPMKVGVDHVTNGLFRDLTLELLNQRSRRRKLRMRIHHHHVFRSHKYHRIRIDHGLRSSLRQVNAVRDSLDID